MCCNLTDFTESQLRLIQYGISVQIAENNFHIHKLEEIYEYTELSHHQAYIERELKKADLDQCATKILEAVVQKRMEAIVTCN